MVDLAATFRDTARLIRRHRGLILPVTAAAMIFVVLVPLPRIVVDLLLVANIALAAMILLTTIHVASPLEFSVFPSLLLGATLFRLVLNIATTRLIITAGADGRPVSEATQAAGEVIWAFSSFVTSGSLAVGVILFIILVIIQFVVVTKGASRISEVAARFVLDAMPGRQMAIDSDLSAGVIDKVQARRRREQINRQADFYGAMDGASKFIRGDALAAVIITLVNILGGMYVGLVQYGWTLAETADLFTRLTIGDGLVTQIPAFLVAISAALLVSRSTARTNLGKEVVAQLTARPIVLGITAVFLGALMLTALPKVPLALLGIGCGGLAWMLSRRRQGLRDRRTAGPGAPRGSGVGEDVSVEKLISIDPIQIEIGYSAARLVDESHRVDLLERLGALRRQIAMELGLIVGPVVIRDDMRLEAHTYVVKIRGVKVAEGRIYPTQLLAVGGGETTGLVIGRRTVEPVSGAEAFWITPMQKHCAETMGYTIVEPPMVLMSHLDEIIRRNAARLLSRQQVSRMLEALAPAATDLVTEVNKKVPTHIVHKVLGNLLSERVPIRDLESVLEGLCDGVGRSDDPEVLTEHVRGHLGRSLSQQYCGDDGKLWCVSLAAGTEDAIQTRLDDGGDAGGDTEPELTARVSRAVSDALGRLRKRGRRPVVLCTPRVRLHLKQILGPTDPDAAVLGYNEIQSVEVQRLENVGVDL